MFCPLCKSLSRFAETVQKADPQKVYRIGRCEVCDLRFDHRIHNVDKEKDAAAQALVNYDFYRPQFSEAEFHDLMSVNTRMMEGLAKFSNIRKTYVEIGVGLGFLTRAAGSFFEEAYGLDLEVETALSVGKTPDNVKFVQHDEFLKHPEVEISTLCAWHVAEHLPDPHAVFEPLFRRVALGGTFVGQIPLYKVDHVFDAHFIWYTEQALLHFCSSYGFSPVYFERDEQSWFLSFGFRKY